MCNLSMNEIPIRTGCPFAGVLVLNLTLNLVLILNLFCRLTDRALDYLYKVLLVILYKAVIHLELPNVENVRSSSWDEALLLQPHMLGKHPLSRSSAKGMLEHDPRL